jgi:hypothetical protein
MPHPLLNKGSNKGLAPPSPPTMGGGGTYSGEVYLNRRKIWEERFSTKEEAFQAAKQKQEQVKNKGKTSIVVRPAI